MSLCAYTSPPADTYIHAFPFLCPFFQPLTSVILLTLHSLHFKPHHHQTRLLLQTLFHCTSNSITIKPASCFKPSFPALQTISPSNPPLASNPPSLPFKLHHHQTCLLLQTLFPCPSNYITIKPASRSLQTLLSLQAR